MAQPIAIELRAVAPARQSTALTMVDVRANMVSSDSRPCDHVLAIHVLAHRPARKLAHCVK